MTAPSHRIRVAMIAALLALCPATPAPAKSHATAHANAAVHAQNAAKQEAAAWQHQEQAMMHQQQAMMNQQMRQQHGNQAHRYPSRNYAHRSNGNRHDYRSYANNNRPANAQIAAGLHSVMAELNRADHDYQGHRAQAAHHLGLAVRSLQPQGANANNLAMNTGPNLNANRVTLTGANGNRNGVAGAPGAAGTLAHRMPQAQSDAHLNRARQGLMTFQNQMASTNGNQHHQAVHNHVQKAMQELNLALNIR